MTSNDYDFCGYRLPCGYCRLLERPCLKGMDNMPNIVWTNSQYANVAPSSASPEQAAPSCDAGKEKKK